MNKLEIPYIGVKIESIPTMLNLLNGAENNDAFVDYYVKLGKKKKTATEYLASLRNLKLAQTSKDKQTIITSAGKNLIIDDVELFYKNLLEHCLKHFKDLKIIRDIIKKDKPATLKELIKFLQNEGYKLNREQTLSSYFKLFYEAEKRENKTTTPHVKTGENLEYNQFVKMVLRSKNKDNIVNIIDLIKAIEKKKAKFTEEMIISYLKTLQQARRIKLFQINTKLIKNKKDVLKINDKYYYYFEVIR